MSKSEGNVVDPFEMANIYGVDQLRYFCLREVRHGSDGSYSHEDIVNQTMRASPTTSAIWRNGRCQ